MGIINPLHLFEVQEIVAEYLDTKTLLACILVCREWSISFRPMLWHVVVVASSSGPDLFNPLNQPFLRHIRHLEFRMSPLEIRLPIWSFTHLATLKICPPKFSRQTYGVAVLWTAMTTIVLTLANGPLSTIELSNEPATVAFWDALASCTRLRTLVLRTLTIPRDQFLSFWRVCFQVESLFLHMARINSDGHATQSWFFKRSARLKHIVLENDFMRDYSLSWARSLSRPWLCTPFLESFRCTGDVKIEDMSGLVEEIEYATKAAAEGRKFYLNGGLAQGSLSIKEDDCHHRRSQTPEDPIDTEQFRGLIPGKRIREFRCPLPYLTSGDLAKVISNMDALEKFQVSKLKYAKLELKPLQKHVSTLVELDIWGCALDEITLVQFLEQCPRLRVFHANNIHVGVAVGSKPWVCTGLRHLRVEFYILTPNQEFHNEDAFEQDKERLLARLAGLTCLETFVMPEFWHGCALNYEGRGMNRLQGLAHVQNVFFSESSVNELQEVDAKWMVEHWLKLTTIHFPAPKYDRRIPVDSVRLLEDYGVKCLSD